MTLYGFDIRTAGIHFTKDLLPFLGRRFDGGKETRVGEGRTVGTDTWRIFYTDMETDIMDQEIKNMNGL
jgi:hypothetical protein